MKHYNPTISKRFVDNLNVKGESTNDVEEYIQPTVMISQGVTTDNVHGNTRTTTGSLAIYTTATDKDFYCVGVAVSFSKNAACDVASGALQLSMYIGGVVTYPILLSVQTLTAESGHIFYPFVYPVKVDRNTNISFSGTFTAGAMVRSGTVFGYYH